MLVSQKANKPSEQKAQNKNELLVASALTPKQQQKQDALELAEVIYDIFKNDLSDANILLDSKKEDQNA